MKKTITAKRSKKGILDILLNSGSFLGLMFVVAFKN